MSKELSIVIITHDNKQILIDCLQSIYQEKQAAKLDLEVIVVFNKCSDDSQSVVEKEYPEVICINNPLNEGFSRANNHGLKKATGKKTMLLNDDTIIKPGGLKALINYLNCYPKVGAVGPKLLNPDGSLQVAGSKLASWKYKTNNSRKVSFLGFAAIMFQDNIKEEVGLLDENYFFYNEELDYQTRIKKLGYSLFYLPQAEIMHIGGHTTKSRNLDFELEGVKGTLYFLSKFHKFIYPIYRLIFGLSALLFCPIYMLIKIKEKKERDFLWKVLIISLTWRKKTYEPRKYF